MTLVVEQFSTNGSGVHTMQNPKRKHTKTKNVRQKLLNAIRSAGFEGISREELHRNTGISLGAITQHTKKLKQEGEVEEAEPAPDHNAGKTPGRLRIHIDQVAREETYVEKMLRRQPQLLQEVFKEDKPEFHLPEFIVPEQVIQLPKLELPADQSKTEPKPQSNKEEKSASVFDEMAKLTGLFGQQQSNPTMQALYNLVQAMRNQTVEEYEKRLAEFDAMLAVMKPFVE